MHIENSWKICIFYFFERVFYLRFHVNKRVNYLTAFSRVKSNVLFFPGFQPYPNYIKCSLNPMI